MSAVDEMVDRGAVDYPSGPMARCQVMQIKQDSGSYQGNTSRALDNSVLFGTGVP